MTVVGTTFRSLLAAIALVALAACGVADAGSTGDGFGRVESREEREAGSSTTLTELWTESRITQAILSKANGATLAELRAAGFSDRAAQGVLANRPFSSLATLAAVPYVADPALNGLLTVAAPEARARGAAFYEEVLVNAEQASAILEMANGLELGTLGCDLGLGSTMAGRVLAARPYGSVQQLVDVPYVGAAQLGKFKVAVPTFTTGEGFGAGNRFDCVAFTASLESAALRVANEAGFSQLALPATGRNAILAGRPFADLASVAAARGVGPISMQALHALAKAELDGTLVLKPDSIRGIREGTVGTTVQLANLKVLGVMERTGIFQTTWLGEEFEVTCGVVADAADARAQEEGRTALYCLQPLSKFECSMRECTTSAWIGFADRLAAAAATGEPVSAYGTWSVEPQGLVVWEKQ